MGGPLALVAPANLITLDVPGRDLTLHVATPRWPSDGARGSPTPGRHAAGRLYIDHVLQAESRVRPSTSWSEPRFGGNAREALMRARPPGSDRCERRLEASSDNVDDFDRRGPRRRSRGRGSSAARRCPAGRDQRINSAGRALDEVAPRDVIGPASRTGAATSSRRVVDGEALPRTRRAELGHDRARALVQLGIRVRLGQDPQRPRRPRPRACRRCTCRVLTPLARRPRAARASCEHLHRVSGPPPWRSRDVAVDAEGSLRPRQAEPESVITSSTTIVRRDADRGPSPSRKPGPGAIRPVLHMIGSMITARPVQLSSTCSTSARVSTRR